VDAINAPETEMLRQVNFARRIDNHLCSYRFVLQIPLVDRHACVAYYIGMQYTLRNIPPEVDRALREKARREGRSLNDVAIEALRRMLEIGPGELRHRDLSDVVGTLKSDSALDEALESQRKIDPDLWK
jgi:hypothetical protein